MEKIKKTIESKAFKFMEHVISILFLVWVAYRFYDKPNDIIYNVSCLIASILAIIININKNKIQKWIEKQIKIAIIKKNI